MKGWIVMRVRFLVLLSVFALLLAAVAGGAAGSEDVSGADEVSGDGSIEPPVQTPPAGAVPGQESLRGVLGGLEAGDVRRVDMADAVGLDQRTKDELEAVATSQEALLRWRAVEGSGEVASAITEAARLFESGRQASVEFSPFDGVDVRLETELSESQGEDGTIAGSVWIEGEEQGWFSAARVDDQFSLRVTVAGGHGRDTQSQFKIGSTSEPTVALVREAELSGIAPYPERAEARASGDSAVAVDDFVARLGQIPGPVALSSDGPGLEQVTVMYAYDSRAVTKIQNRFILSSFSAGRSKMMALVVLDMSEANLVLQNSNVSRRFKILEFYRTNSPYTLAPGDDVCDTRDQVRASNDGILDDIPTERNQIGADLVGFLGDIPGGACANGYDNAPLDSSKAFVASDVTCFAGDCPLVGAHEFGHLLGMHHDVATVGLPPGYHVYSHAFINPTGTGNQKLLTVLGSMNPGNGCAQCIRIPFYSTDTIVHNGVTIGSSTARNARTAQQLMSDVAAYRTTKSDFVGVASRNINGSLFWTGASLGAVVPHNGASWLGDRSKWALLGKVVAIEGNGTSHGYWLTTDEGKIYNYNASHKGDASSLPLTKPIIGMGVQNSSGYWLAASDGAIFAYSSPFYGSLPALGISVNNIVGIAPRPQGDGYWLVGSDGGVFGFGAAGFHGSLPGLGISVNNIVAIESNMAGNGYWMLGSDGGVFAFGGAPFRGSFGGSPDKFTDLDRFGVSNVYRVLTEDGSVARCTGSCSWED